MNLVKRCLIFLLAAGLLLPAIALPGAVLAQEDPDTPDDIYKVFLPLAHRHLPSVDLTYIGIEITQGTQTDSNSVAMIANRPTLVRVYAVTNLATPAANVRLSVSAQRNGATLAGSPMVVGPNTLTQSVARTNMASSFNVQLPAAWLAGRVTLLFALDSSNAVAEVNESNNSTGMTVDFNSTPTLNIKVVPINYTHPPTGKFYPAASTAYMAPAFMRMYPVAAVVVTTRTGISFSQNLSSDTAWENLLDIVTNLYEGDGRPPNQVYYGPVPLLDSNGNSWFTGGVAGLGWVNYPASVGLANAPSIGIDGGWIVTHEVGHNMNRRHAPCGVSGADGSYPYSGGKIGQIGMDVPALALKLHTLYTDFMGYCDDYIWVSDYTYNGILAKRNADALIIENQTARDTLMVRLFTDGSGESITPAPAYALRGYASPADEGSEYAVEFLDTAGERIARYPLQVAEAEEEGVFARRISGLIPLPAAPFASYRVVRRGETLAQADMLAAPDAAVKSVAEPPAARLSGDRLVLSWVQPGVPVLVRYTVDGGLTWTTLAVDAVENSLSIFRNDLPEGTIRFEIIPADRLDAALTLDWENIR